MEASLRREAIKKELFSDRVIVELLVPYSRGDVGSYLCDKCKVLKMDYQETGTYFEAELSKADFGRFREYMI